MAKAGHKVKIKLSFIFMILGLVFLFLGSGIVMPPMALVSFETPIATVKAEGITPVQAGSLFVGALLLALGIVLYLKKK